LTARREPGQLLTVTESTEAQPFDERSALEALEQLADKIQLSRNQREQKVAEFDAFVRTFRHDRYNASIAATERERRAGDRPAASEAVTHAARGNGPVTQAGASQAAVSAAEPSADAASNPWSFAVPTEPVAHVAVNRPGRPRAAYVGVALAALAVVLVTVLLWRSADTPVGPDAQPANS
jgi:leucyl aminopeptidase (aminopeptidase T)